MKKTLFPAMLNCFLIILTIASFAFGQKNETALKDKKITLHLNNQSLGDAFIILIGEYEVVIGFEESMLDQEDNSFENFLNVVVVNPNAKLRKVTINVNDARLEDVMDIIVQKLGDYKWEINDDAINILPIRGRSEKYEKLLNLKIEKFQLGNGDNSTMAREKLLELPEVVKFLKENKMSPSKSIPDPNYPGYNIQEELTFSNLTLREILNKIGKIKFCGWILKRNRTAKSTDEIEVFDLGI